MSSSHPTPTPTSSESTLQENGNGSTTTKPAADDVKIVESNGNGAPGGGPDGPESHLPPKGHVAVPLTKGAFALVFLGLALALFLAALDMTIIATALPAIGQDFKAFDMIPWIGISYLLTATAVSPLYGKFSDIFGRKAMFLWAILIFEIGSAICGAAQSMGMLVAGRAIAGIGGGGLFSLVLIIISDIVSFEDRGKYQGMFGAVFALASVIGPLLGGAFTDSYLTWRWCFYINLPIGLVTIVVVYFLLKFPAPTGSIRDKLRRIDYLGTFALVAGIIVLLIPLQLGGSQWPWNDAKTISMLVLAVVILGVFVFIEAKVAVEPIIPGAMFENRSVALILGIAFCLGAAFMSLTFYVPLYFQLVNGETATQSGLETLPLMLGVTCFSIICGQLMSRTGYYVPFYFSGGILLTVGAALISTLTAESNRGMQIGYLFIAGVGVGNLVQTRVIGIQASVSLRNIAVATATSNFCQTLGGVIGIAIVGTIFNNLLTTHIQDAISSGTVHLPPGLQSPEGVMNAASKIRSIPDPAVVSVITSAFTESLGMAFKATLPFAGLILVCAAFVKQYRRQAGNAAPPVVAE
ncbi:hypothetical protein HK104_009691 [Borealophlyctis nickersoniae]|nr:hypothetical protein HK104_009691 [Borealophlyctis nickersoniae]